MKSTQGQEELELPQVRKFMETVHQAHGETKTRQYQENQQNLTFLTFKDSPLPDLSGQDETTVF